MTRMVRYLATAAATVLLATAGAACGKASAPAGSGPTNSASPGSTPTTPSSTPAMSTVQAQLSEFKITLSATAFTPGQETFAITNVGHVPHELLVFRPDVAPAQFPVTAEGMINED